MSDLINVESTRFTNNGTDSFSENLLVEEALEININGQPFTVTMRTPGQDNDLIRGLLHSENVISESISKINIAYQKDIKNDATIANVILEPLSLSKNEFSDRSLMSVSSCGICGKTDIDALGLDGDQITKTGYISLQQLNNLFSIMEKEQKAFLMSGGAHAAAAFDGNGNLLAIKEDIGRHNAVDKVIGNLIQEDNYSKVIIILVSGRTSFEIVSKAANANIPILAAVSAPSSLAVSCAEKMNLTLLGFCREGRATCYAHSERIS